MLIADSWCSECAKNAKGLSASREPPRSLEAFDIEAGEVVSPDDETGELPHARVVSTRKSRNNKELGSLV